ncbi:MAG: GtrA family protein [Candidatus Ornithospirochaeta sp.]
MEEKKEKSGLMPFIRARATFIRYCAAGAAATALETGLYMAFYEVLGLSNVFSAFISWVVTVLFAFFTNKYLVYVKKERGGIMKELLGFFSCRGGTGVFNLVWMFVTVDVLSLPPFWMKLMSALMVGIINYLVGKLMIFRKK